ncbi:helix-turn-helix domain-containing protein [Nocardia sp. NPDC051833]|uniref:helix-turn-helix transcriptional regulator n=1 Tax=Nocardia sp. NPDC051833 TaxID=3155674 RepID=UPI0034204CD9
MPTKTNQPDAAATIETTVAGRGNQPLWTIADLAAYLKVPEQTIYDWRVKGFGPKAVRMGKSLRWRPAAVEAWIESLEDAAA